MFEGSQIGGFIGAFAVVLGLLGATLWALKKVMGKTSKQNRGLFEIKGTMPIGTGTFSRAQLMLVNISGRDVLIGVTPTNISALSEWSGGASGTSQITKNQVRSRIVNKENSKS